MWRRITLAIVLALALCSRIFLGLSADYEKENQAFILLHHLPGLAIEFIIGALLWAWVRRSDQLLLWPAVLGVIAWLGLAQHFANVGDAGIQASILKGQLGGLAALCYACLMATCIRWVRSARCESVFKADFVICFCQWAGKLSYGTYLFHIAVLRAAQAFSLEYQLAHLPSPEWLALGLTLLLAFLAHRFWEDPCRSLGRRLANAIKA
jgi:peptidoglycan/LPS O-acetylase OafA/YrhL